METKPRTILTYATNERNLPYIEWLKNLHENIRAIIRKRVARLGLGDFGDSKYLEEGVHELRIHIGAGYRVYYGLDGQDIVLLLSGGKNRRKIRIFKKQRSIGMITKKENYPPAVPYEDLLIESFRKNPDEAILYLRSCMEDNDPPLFLLALSQVSKALGGIAKVAEKTGLNREHLYKTLSKSGNPTWTNVNAVVNSLGFQFELKPIPSPRKKSIRKRANVKSR